MRINFVSRVFTIHSCDNPYFCLRNRNKLLTVDQCGVIFCSVELSQHAGRDVVQTRDISFQAASRPLCLLINSPHQNNRLRLWIDVMIIDESIKNVFWPRAPSYVRSRTILPVGDYRRRYNKRPDRALGKLCTFSPQTLTTLFACWQGERHI